MLVGPSNIRIDSEMRGTSGNLAPSSFDLDDGRKLLAAAQRYGWAIAADAWDGEADDCSPYQATARGSEAPREANN
jgi:hypothetical protein